MIWQWREAVNHVQTRTLKLAENLNWTREYSARDTLTGDYTLRNSSQKASNKNTSYHDGLGRPNQQRNYLQIKHDVRGIILSEMDRLVNDPGKKHLVIRKK